MFEYMAAECAVIASDLPTIRRIVSEAGCGVLVKPDDTSALTAAIEDLAADPDRLAKYGRLGREAIETRLNWENEAQQLTALYDRIAEGRS